MAKLTPYPFQLEDLAQLRANNYTGLVAVEPGGGKSLLATMAIAEAKPAVTLIIAPQSTHKTAWIPTVRDNAGITPRIIGNSNKDTKLAYNDFLIGVPGVYLVTGQWIARTDVSRWSGDMIIHDESHIGSTPKSALQRKIGGYSAQDGQPLTERFTYRLALSGTPARQNFATLWGTMRFLWPDLGESGEVAYRNFVMWQSQRMNWQEVYTNQRDQWGKPKTVKQYLSESEPGRLFREMPCVIVHKRRETCCRHHSGGFLPTDEPQVINREVELTAKQRKNVREMEDMMMTYVQSNPLIADIPLVQRQRIRQLSLAEATVETYEKDGEEKTTIQFDKDCASPFLDETIHILNNLPENEAVLVLLESQRFAEVVTYRLNQAGITASEYSGVRKADLTRFGQDYRVLVGVVSAVGTGTAGLNHVCNTEIILEQPISLTMQAQSQSRLDRLDNRKRVQRYNIFDSEGVQRSRYMDNLEKALVINRSLRKVA
jgi:hypothetical protein